MHLVEIGVMEQRYEAVRAVQDGWKVTEVAERWASRARPCIAGSCATSREACPR